MLKTTLKVGDLVHFVAPRFTQPVAAIVTKVEFDPSCDDTRHIALTAFPPGAPPIALTSVQHRSLWAKASHELDGYWDFPAAEDVA